MGGGKSKRLGGMVLVAMSLVCRGMIEISSSEEQIQEGATSRCIPVYLQIIMT